jgi:hypothetical protein
MSERLRGGVGCATCRDRWAREGRIGHCPHAQIATCETHGHLWGRDGACLFCKTPQPSPGRA